MGEGTTAAATVEIASKHQPIRKRGREKHPEAKVSLPGLGGLYSGEIM